MEGRSRPAEQRPIEGGAGGTEENAKGKESEGSSDRGRGSGGDSSRGGGGGGGSAKRKATGTGGLGSGGVGGSGGGGFELRVDKTMVGMAAVLLLVYVALDHAASPSSREITFQDFRNNFLETGRVQRLIVHSERKTVTVQLKVEGTAGQSATSDGFSSDQDINDKPSSSLPSSSSGAARPASSFHFAIGSVEAFERALDEAQKEMGLDPRDHVQVQYQPDKATFGSAVTFFQLFVLGLLAYQLFKGMSAMSGGGFPGGGGGGRGGRNIFSIGKSPATLIKPGEMTKTTFSDVAGLDEAKVEVLEFVKFLKGPRHPHTSAPPPPSPHLRIAASPLTTRRCDLARLPCLACAVLCCAVLCCAVLCCAVSVAVPQPPSSSPASERRSPKERC